MPVVAGVLVTAKIVGSMMLRWRVAVTSVSVVALILIPVRVMGRILGLRVVTSTVTVPNILLRHILVLARRILRPECQIWAHSANSRWIKRKRV
jgi:hypothetical protein